MPKKILTLPRNTGFKEFLLVKRKQEQLFGQSRVEQILPQLIRRSPPMEDTAAERLLHAHPDVVAKLLPEHTDPVPEHGVIPEPHHHTHTIRDEIKVAAYYIWQKNGSKPNDIDTVQNWLLAEEQIRCESEKEND